MESVLRQPRRLALLAYLAAATPRGPQRRDKLLALFWPESDESRARAALNQALYVLRSGVGDGAFTSSGDEVGLDFNAVWCDVSAFADALDAGRAEEALTLYRGDLLDGFHIGDGPEFERWVDEERARLRQRASDGAWTLAEARAAAGDVAGAQRWAGRAMDLAPGSEAVVRRLMLFLRGLGDRASAMRAYEAFAWQLSREYALDPSAETVALAAAIRDEERSVSAPVLADVPPAVAPPIGSQLGVSRHPYGFRWARLTAVLAIVLAIGALGPWASRGSDPAPANAPGVWTSLLDVDDAPPGAEGLIGTPVAVSRDGDIAYVGLVDGGTQLFLKRRDHARPEPFENALRPQQPFFSPDGEWIGYTLANTIRKVRASGGRSLEIYRGSSIVVGASWGDDETIVMALEDGLYRVPASGGEATPVAVSDSAEWYRWPDVLPGSRTAMFTIVSDAGFELAAISLASGDVHRLGVPGTSPRFVEPELLLWTSPDGVLLASRFDPESLRLDGPTRTLTEDVFVGMGGVAKLGAAPGTLAYVPSQAGNALVIVDTLGRERTLPNLVGFEEPKFTPNGDQVIAAHRLPDSRLANIVSVDPATNELRRITHDSGGFGPVVSPTTPLRVAFASKPAGRPHGFAIGLASGPSADPTTLRAAEPRQRPKGFSPDGRYLVFQRHTLETQFDIWYMRLDSVGHVMPYLRGPAIERGPAIAPNGAWLAFVITDAGREDVYIGEFPELRQAVKVSVTGGRQPRWARDGEALYYRGDRGMTRVDIVSYEPLVLGERRVLFDDRPYEDSYDVHPDDDRFVMLRRTEDRGRLLVRLGRLDDPR